MIGCKARRLAEGRNHKMQKMSVRRRVGIGVAALALAAAAATPAALGHGTSGSYAKANGPGDVNAGAQIFVQYFCADCHTLKAAGFAVSHGILGPNLDKLHAPYAVVKATVENGLPAALPLYPTEMVGFKNVLTSEQIDDVAAYVYAGTHGLIKAPTTTAQTT
jgi:mono/diheme cytochrome c family protein